MISFLFLRHGPSEWNHEKRWQGQQDPPLSTQGAKLAESWAAAISDTDIEFAEIWASNLQRATKTAQIIGEALGKDAHIDERLKERYLSVWEGLKREEIDAKWPGAIEKRIFPEDSESDAEVMSRTLSFLQDKLTNFAEVEIKYEADTKNEAAIKYLIVAHGGLITCLEKHLGREWERLSNLKGRWFFCEPPYTVEKLQLGKRVDYLKR